MCACVCSSVYLLKQLAMNKEMEMTLVAHMEETGKVTKTMRDPQKINPAEVTYIKLEF